MLAERWWKCLYMYLPWLPAARSARLEMIKNGTPKIFAFFLIKCRHSIVGLIRFSLTSRWIKTGPKRSRCGMAHGYDHVGVFTWLRNCVHSVHLVRYLSCRRHTDTPRDISLFSAVVFFSRCVCFLAQNLNIWIINEKYFNLIIETCMVTVIRTSLA